MRGKEFMAVCSKIIASSAVRCVRDRRNPMRKGRLTKDKNYLKNSIDWERFSSSQGKWIKTQAYLDAHDKKTFCGKTEDNNYHTAFQRGFATIEEAFAWAESQVDYKKGVIKSGGA
jgi:hypothetical protein